MRGRLNQAVDFTVLVMVLYQEPTDWQKYREPTFMQNAANGGSEPILTNVAERSNGSYVAKKPA